MSPERGRSARMIVPALAFVVLLLLIGLAVALGLRQMMNPPHHSDHTTAFRQVSRLAVDVNSADVTVRRGAGDEASVQANLAWSSERPHVVSGVHDGTLTVDTRPCRGGQFGIQVCRVKLTVTVPAATPATLRATSGNITVSDLSAGVDARTDSGDLQAVGLSGRTRLSATSGDITAESLTSRQVRFRADSGNVRLLFGAAPATVAGSVSSGDIQIEVPETTDGYRWVADADSGDVRLPDSGNAHADRTVEASASSGDVTVSYGVS